MRNFAPVARLSYWFVFGTLAGGRHNSTGGRTWEKDGSHQVGVLANIDLIGRSSSKVSLRVLSELPGGHGLLQAESLPSSHCKHTQSSNNQYSKCSSEFY